jgi:hypothetical protein
MNPTLLIMYLLNVNTLQLEEFYDAQIPKYAILSHTWGPPEEEVTFADIQNPTSLTTTSRGGFDKIRKTCEKAKSDGLSYAWVDTCCIDKHSSAELTEAINSMFKWYQDSQVCYAYLSDVSSAFRDEDEWLDSRWFTRGWTLQELLAPENVIFYDQDWNELGTKHGHAVRISHVTGIDAIALTGGRVHYYVTPGLGQFCVAKRMSWASLRETTRVEDMAYCLLGIFNVNMPLVYGEGDRAFIRLQEEIIKSLDDDSILAWGLDTETRGPLGSVPSGLRRLNRAWPAIRTILASSPKDFSNCRNLEYAATSSTPFTMTKSGLHIELPLVPVPRPTALYGHGPDPIEVYLGVLNCSLRKASEFVGILLQAVPHKDQSSQFWRIRHGSDASSNGVVCIGPRAACQAVRKRVTIVQDNEHQEILNHCYGVRQFIVNESLSLLDLGYRVVHASAKNIRYMDSPWADDYPGRWNSTAKEFTISGRNFKDDLVCFEFRSQCGQPHSEFSVFMRGGNASVCSGSSFSIAEERNIHASLKDTKTPPENCVRVMVLNSSNGSASRIVVTVKETHVSFSQIFELNVLAVLD